MLKEQEAGEKTADLCRRYGINQGTFYKYKSKYGGMEPSPLSCIAAQYGLVTLTFRSLSPFMQPFVQMPRGFCPPVMNGGGVDYKTH